MLGTSLHQSKTEPQWQERLWVPSSVIFNTIESFFSFDNEPDVVLQPPRVCASHIHTNIHLQLKKPVLRKGLCVYLSLGRLIYLHFKLFLLLLFKMNGAHVELRRQLSVLCFSALLRQQTLQSAAEPYGPGLQALELPSDPCLSLISQQKSWDYRYMAQISHLASDIHSVCVHVCVFIYVKFSYICVKAYLSCELALSFSMWGLSREYLWRRPTKQVRSFWGAAALTFSSTKMLAILLQFGAKCFGAQIIWP